MIKQWHLFWIKQPNGNGVDMTEKRNETLSALMDGELDELSLHRILGQGKDDIEFRNTWARYHLAREAMKGELSEFSSLDISGAVSEALESEADIVSEAEPKPRNTWWKPVAGLSVAASVAFAVVLGARFSGQVEFAGEQQVASAESRAVSPQLPKQNGASLLADADEVELQKAQERLNAYLKQHAQDSAIGQGRTAMPFARVVNFEDNKASQ